AARRRRAAAGAFRTRTGARARVFHSSTNRRTDCRRVSPRVGRYHRVKMRRAAPALVTSVFIALAMAACGQSAPAAPAAPAQTGATTEPAATSGLIGSTAVGTADAHFNPTEAGGGGAMGTNAVTDA